MQVPRDPVAVLEDGEPLLVALALGEPQRQRRLRGEGLRELLLPSVNGALPRVRQTASPPRTRPDEIIGTAIDGPKRRASRSTTPGWVDMSSK
ncbi:hypothetical protein GCM10025734_46290 [Kitasatospora paranensis]